jgi:hypothetical protein
MKSGSPGTYVNGVPGSDVSGKLFLKFDGLDSHGDPTGADYLGESLDLFFAYRRLMKRYG